MPQSTTAQAVPLESRLLMEMKNEMSFVKESHPDWYAQYEDCDPTTASMAECAELLETAPTQFTKGLLLGVMTFRQQLSILTGRTY